jgi:hypothetical protein
MRNMTKDEMIAAATVIVGASSVRELSIDQILRLMTVTQFVTDRCLNEIERRGELEYDDGVPLVPYCGDIFVETVLTRTTRSVAPKPAPVRLVSDNGPPRA